MLCGTKNLNKNSRHINFLINVLFSICSSEFFDLWLKIIFIIFYENLDALLKKFILDWELLGTNE